jgi:large subunit ribosomal protein L10
MPNLINEIVVRQLSDEFARAEGLLVLSLSGLTVEETEGLRDTLAEGGVRLRMVRNRLATLALEKRGVKLADSVLAGNVACAWGSSEDTIKIAKVVKKAVKTRDPKKTGKLAFRGGFFEGNALDAQSAEALAELPGKDELRAMFLGLLSGPARSLATLFAAPGTSLARVIDAHAQKGEAPA